MKQHKNGVPAALLLLFCLSGCSALPVWEDFLEQKGFLPPPENSPAAPAPEPTVAPATPSPAPAGQETPYPEYTEDPEYQEPIPYEELSLELLNLNAQGVSPAVRKIRFKVLLAELFTHFFLPRQSAGGADAPKWLENLCEKMGAPENFIPGLKRMQQLSGYTPEYLCKIFRKHLGRTPTEFINELRINYAARMLADSDESIAELAYHLNFQSLSRFYHLFHRQYSCTPAEYRKRALAARRLL